MKPKSFLFLILLVFLFVFESQGTESRHNPENQNSLFKTGISFSICGVVLGTAAGIMFATNKASNPSQMEDANYKNKQRIAGGMITIAIPATTVGAVMTIMGKKHKNK
jgi:hypothetical protein